MKVDQWQPITISAGKLALGEEWLVSRDMVDILLADGSVLTAEWYADPHNRPAVFVTVQLEGSRTFKSSLYLPHGVLARRIVC